jgi:hypothetical protein
MLSLPRARDPEPIEERPRDLAEPVDRPGRRSGQFGIGERGGHLDLPQVEIALGEVVFVGLVGHGGGTIPGRRSARQGGAR